MRTITLAQLQHLKRAHPAAYESVADGHHVVIVPTFDLQTGDDGEERFRVLHDEIDAPAQGYKPGDVVFQDGRELHVKSPADFMDFEVRDGAENDPEKTKTNSFLAQVLGRKRT